jgi:hypothetical protein
MQQAQQAGQRIYQAHADPLRNLINAIVARTRSPEGEWFPEAVHKKPREEQSQIWKDYFSNLAMGATAPLKSRGAIDQAIKLSKATQPKGVGGGYDQLDDVAKAKSTMAGDKPVSNLLHTEENYELVKDYKNKKMLEFIAKDGKPVSEIFIWKEGYERQADEAMKMVKDMNQGKLIVDEAYHTKLGKLFGYSEQDIKNFSERISPTQPKGVGEITKPIKTREFGFDGMYEVKTRIPTKDIARRNIKMPEFRDERVVERAGREVKKPIVALVKDIRDPSSPIDIVDGWHRYRQAIANKDKTIPIKFILDERQLPQLGNLIK